MATPGRDRADLDEYTAISEMATTRPPVRPHPAARAKQHRPPRSFVCTSAQHSPTQRPPTRFDRHFAQANMPVRMPAGGMFFCAGRELNTVWHLEDLQLRPRWNASG